MLKKSLGLIVIALCVSGAASAVPITYSYSSQPFAQPLPAGIPAGVTSLTGTFTVDLPAYSVFHTATLTDWSFTDGVTTLTSANADANGYSFGFSMFDTNAAGEITTALVMLYRNANSPGHQGFRFGFGNYNSFDAATWYCRSYEGGCRQQAEIYTSNGTLAAVPEPATLALLGIGLAGVGIARRRRPAA